MLRRNNKVNDHHTSSGIIDENVSLIAWQSAPCEPFPDQYATTLFGLFCRWSVKRMALRRWQNVCEWDGSFFSQWSCGSRAVYCGCHHLTCAPQSHVKCARAWPSPARTQVPRLMRCQLRARVHTSSEARMLSARTAQVRQRPATQIDNPHHSKYNKHTLLLHLAHPAACALCSRTDARSRQLWPFFYWLYGFTFSFFLCISVSFTHSEFYLQSFFFNFVVIC